VQRKWLSHIPVFCRAILLPMMLNSKQLLKPVQKLRKTIKKLPKNPSPEQVHRLRTRSRRVEAAARALKLDETKRGRRLLRAVAPVRKRAGKVRDLDVLTGLTASIANGIQSSGSEQQAIQLLHSLGLKRFRFAKQLYEGVAGKRKKALRRLKSFSKLIQRKMAEAKRAGPGVQRWQTGPTAAAVYLSASLAAWPKLSEENLHPLPAAGERAALCAGPRM
jgi:CHAD domain-containing protein